MEEAIGVSAQTLMALQPDLDDIRTMLRPAFTRRTTKVEDAVCSMLGTFALSLSIVYDGDGALERLSSSEDASILVWTGKPGSYSSCLPTKISVFNPDRVFRAQTIALGIVEIRTEENLSRLSPLCLAHPWIDFLLDRQPVGSVIRTEHTQSVLPNARVTSWAVCWAVPRRPRQCACRDFLYTLGYRLADVVWVSFQPSSIISQMDIQTRVLWALARLRRPFGALLSTPNPSNVSAYSRVARAMESLITVQVEEVTPMMLPDSVRMLDLL